MGEQILPRSASSDDADASKSKGKAGIEGLLLIPAGYLLLAAFVTTEYLREAQLPWLRPEVLAGNVAVVAGSVVMLVLFFQKRAIVPALMVVYLVTVAAVCGLEVLSLTRLSEGLPAAVISAELEEARHGLDHTVAMAIIWIPYFLVSERVKNTFVE